MTSVLEVKPPALSMKGHLTSSSQLPPANTGSAASQQTEGGNMDHQPCIRLGLSSSSSTDRSQINGKAPDTIHRVAKKVSTHRKYILDALKKGQLNFPINDECTSLTITPSGHFLIGGFSDGTVRIFDLTGTFHSTSSKKNKNGSSLASSSRTSLDLLDVETNDQAFDEFIIEGKESEEQELEDDRDTDEHNNDNDDNAFLSSRKRNKTSQYVLSKSFAKHGAVACQIHARGVHTDLLLHVEVSPDGMYCFAGVQRGSMELHAVYLGALEKAVSTAAKYGADKLPQKHLLDYITVEQHSDAKLKGFGACTCVDMNEDGHIPQKSPKKKYFLLTGKAIKNIHIWSFVPPVLHPTTKVELEPAQWEQLYDTQTNGNTIRLLGFSHNTLGNGRTGIGKRSKKAQDPNLEQQRQASSGLSNRPQLWAISQSDTQKMRLWDLGKELTIAQMSKSEASKVERPKRPPYQDVLNTESALGLAGPFCICGGAGMFNQMSIVRLDQPKAQYNHTELALPTDAGEAAIAASASSRSSRRRPQRGDLKLVTSVATLPNDASHVLLELDDGSMVQYVSNASGADLGLPKLEVMGEDTIPTPPSNDYQRKVCVSVMMHSVVAAAVSLYNPISGQGHIAVRALDWSVPSRLSSGNMMTPPPESTASQKRRKKAKAMKSADVLGPNEQKCNTNTVEATASVMKKSKQSIKVPITSSVSSEMAGSVTSPPRIQRSILSSRPHPDDLFAETPPKIHRLSPGETSASSKQADHYKLERTISMPSSEERSVTKSVAKCEKGGYVGVKLQFRDGAAKSMKESRCIPQTDESTQSPSLIGKTSSRLESLSSKRMAQVSPEQKEEPPTAKQCAMPTKPVNGITKFLKKTKSDPTAVKLLAVKKLDMPLAVKAKISPKFNEAGSASKPGDEINLKSFDGNSLARSLLDLKNGKVAKPKDQTSKVLQPFSSSHQDITCDNKTLKQVEVSPDSTVAKVGLSSAIPRRVPTLPDEKTSVDTVPRKKKKSKMQVPPPPPPLNDERMQCSTAAMRSNTSPNIEKLKVATSLPAPLVGVKFQDVKPSQGSIVIPKMKKRVREEDLSAIPSKKLKRRKSLGEVSRSSNENIIKNPHSDDNSSSLSKSEKHMLLKNGISRQQHDVRFREVIQKHHGRLKKLINSLPKGNVMLRLKLKKPTHFDDVNSRQKWERTRLEAEHLAAHEMVHRRLLQAAENILADVSTANLSASSAKSELSDSLQSYKELVSATIQRQKLEANSLLQQHGHQKNGMTSVRAVRVSFPFESTFQSVEDILNKWTPMVGRPSKPVQA